jgi:hypothetical protein
MKKVMMIAAAIFTVATVSAQTEAHFGIKGGMNASQLHSTNNSGNGGSTMDTRIGYHAGVLVHIHKRASHWAIQPEVMYSLEGAKNNLVGSSDKAFTNLSYINVPVLVQYMFDNGFRIQAGPQLGLLVAAKYKIKDTKTDIKNQFKTTAFSIPAGVSYLTRNGLGFDARYSFGISDLSEGTSNYKLHGNNFQFGIFYQFSDPKIKK